MIIIKNNYNNIILSYHVFNHYHITWIMSYHIKSYHIGLYCTILHCNILCNAILYEVICMLYCIVILYYTIRYHIMLCDILLYDYNIYYTKLLSITYYDAGLLLFIVLVLESPARWSPNWTSNCTTLLPEN